MVEQTRNRCSEMLQKEGDEDRKFFPKFVSFHSVSIFSSRTKNWKAAHKNRESLSFSLSRSRNSFSLFVWLKSILVLLLLLYFLPLLPLLTFLFFPSIGLKSYFSASFGYKPLSPPHPPFDKDSLHLLLKFSLPNHLLPPPVFLFSLSMSLLTLLSIILLVCNIPLI